jgi:hypothetical protein
MAGTNIIEKVPAEQSAGSPPKIEQGPNPENKAEQILAQPPRTVEAPLASSARGVSGAAPASRTEPDAQQQRAAAIDDILSSDLNDIFLKMPPAQQREFKQQGEAAVTQINSLLNRTKVKVTKIIDLIKAWLKLIPGINKFFLEQEAKIKADKIVKLKDKF